MDLYIVVQGTVLVGLEYLPDHVRYDREAILVELGVMVQLSV